MPEPLRPTVVDRLGPPSSTAAPEDACVIVIYGAGLGRRIPLEGHDTLVIGRDHDCEILVDDDTVSRRHVKLFFDGKKYRVRDLESTNGTFVNDVLRDEHVLCDGDQLRIGRAIFKFLHGSHIEAGYHEVIYQLMTNDGLTGAFNRRHFEQQLASELARAARYERQLGLILFDIDHFKKVNDTLGHLAGDEVLRQLAATVSTVVRKEDVFARIGGEEFALLVPEATLAGVGTLAERLRVQIELREILVDGAPIRVTCSFGVAQLSPTRDLRPRAFYEQADRALYAAKHAGRNCVSTAP